MTEPALLRRPRYFILLCVALAAAVQGVLIALALSGTVRALRSELYLSLQARLLEKESTAETLVEVTTWTARAFTADPGWDAEQYAEQYRDPLIRASAGKASCDQQVSLMQYFLWRHGIRSRVIALFGSRPVSRHTVLEVEIDGRRVIADPYLGWILRTPKGKLATFDDLSEGRFNIVNIDPEDHLGTLDRDRYIALFSGDYPAQILGHPLDESYSIKGKILVLWSQVTAAMISPMVEPNDLLRRAP